MFGSNHHANRLIATLEEVKANAQKAWQAFIENPARRASLMHREWTVAPASRDLPMVIFMLNRYDLVPPTGLIDAMNRFLVATGSAAGLYASKRAWRRATPNDRRIGGEFLWEAMPLACQASREISKWGLIRRVRKSEEASSEWLVAGPTVLGRVT